MLSPCYAGMRLRYLHWGDAGNEEVVLLLHDVGEAAEVWSAVAEQLADEGYRVFALDLRGKTTAPPLLCVMLLSAESFFASETAAPTLVPWYVSTCCISLGHLETLLKSLPCCSIAERWWLASPGHP